MIEAIEAGAVGVVVALEPVTFVDSAGFSALVAAAKRLRPCTGRVALITSDASVLRMLRIMGLAEVLPAFPTLSEAWAAVEPTR